MRAEGPSPTVPEIEAVRRRLVAIAPDHAALVVIDAAITALEIGDLRGAEDLMLRAAVLVNPHALETRH